MLVAVVMFIITAVALAAWFAEAIGDLLHDLFGRGGRG